jgi:hypothetical protein
LRSTRHSRPWWICTPAWEPVWGMTCSPPPTRWTPYPRCEPVSSAPGVPPPGHRSKGPVTQPLQTGDDVVRPWSHLLDERVPAVRGWCAGQSRPPRLAHHSFPARLGVPVLAGQDGAAAEEHWSAVVPDAVICAAPVAPWMGGVVPAVFVDLVVSPTVPPPGHAGLVLHKARFERQNDGLHPVAHSKFGQHIPDVSLDRRLGQEEFGGDLAVG